MSARALTTKVINKSFGFGPCHDEIMKNSQRFAHDPMWLLQEGKINTGNPTSEARQRRNSHS